MFPMFTVAIIIMMNKQYSSLQGLCSPVTVSCKNSKLVTVFSLVDLLVNWETTVYVWSSFRSKLCSKKLGIFLFV